MASSVVQQFAGVTGETAGAGVGVAEIVEGLFDQGDLVEATAQNRRHGPVARVVKAQGSTTGGFQASLAKLLVQPQQALGAR